MDHLDTLAVHAGRDDLADLGVHTPPLDLSSTYPLPDVERGGDSYEALAGGGTPLAGGSHVYARLWNPTVARFEQALAALEGADAAVAFAFPPLLALAGNSTFFIFAAINVASLAFVALMLPETRGKSLEQIETLMRERFGETDKAAASDAA